MKKISKNLVKVGVLLVIGLSMLSIGKNVNAEFQATNKVETLPTKAINYNTASDVVKVTGGGGIWAYEITDPKGNKSSSQGAKTGYTSKLTGTAQVYWGSNYWLGDGTKKALSTTINLQATTPGEYTIKFIKGIKKYEGNWDADKSDTTYVQKVVVLPKDLRQMPTSCSRYVFMNRRSEDETSLSSFKNPRSVVYVKGDVKNGIQTIRPITANDNFGIRVENNLLRVSKNAKLSRHNAKTSDRTYFYLYTDDKGWLQISVMDLELKFKEGNKEVKKDSTGAYLLEKGKEYKMEVVEHFVDGSTLTTTLSNMCKPGTYKERAIIYDNTSINGTKATNDYAGGNNDTFKANEINRFSKVIKSGVNNTNYYYADYANNKFQTGNEDCSFTYNLDWRNYYTGKGGSWIKIETNLKIGDAKSSDAAEPTPSSGTTKPTTTTPTPSTGSVTQNGTNLADVTKGEILKFTGTSWNLYSAKKLASDGGKATNILKLNQHIKVLEIDGKWLTIKLCDADGTESGNEYNLYYGSEANKYFETKTNGEAKVEENVENSSSNEEIPTETENENTNNEEGKLEVTMNGVITFAKGIWEKLIKPMLQYLIQNVLPMLGETVTSLFGGI